MLVEIRNGANPTLHPPQLPLPPLTLFLLGNIFCQACNDVTGRKQQEHILSVDNYLIADKEPLKLENPPGLPLHAGVKNTQLR